MNETLAKNVTVAMASQTALRSNPVYTQVTMIIIQGRTQVVILKTIVKWLFLLHSHDHLVCVPTQYTYLYWR